LILAALALGCGSGEDASPGAQGVTPPVPETAAEQLPGGGGPGGGSMFHNVRYVDEQLTDEGFAAWLAEQRENIGVLQLDFSGNRLTAASVKLLLESRIGAIYTLQLSRNPIGDDGVEAIAQSPRTRQVANLYLRGVGMTDRGAAALAASPEVASLLYLALGGNRLTETGIAALKNSPHLEHCEIDLAD